MSASYRICSTCSALQDSEDREEEKSRKYQFQDGSSAEHRAQRLRLTGAAMVMTSVWAFFFFFFLEEGVKEPCRSASRGVRGKSRRARD